MRWNCLISIVLAAAGLNFTLPCNAAGFGTVVAIGGQAADIALDESRGVVYVSNFAAHRIDVVSTADFTIHTSMNVPDAPGALALSPDFRLLAVAHYGDVSGSLSLTNPPNAVTLINLNDHTHQTIGTGDTPLGVAFINDGRLLVVTTTSFLLLDPVSGYVQPVDTFANLSKSLAIGAGTFPPQVVETEMAASADGYTVYGIADAGAGNAAQVLYRYDARQNQVFTFSLPATPTLLPRISVAADGSWAMAGYAVFDRYGHELAQYPDVVASANITGNAIDSKSGIIYAQIPDASTPLGPPFSPAVSPAAQVSSTKLPVLSIMDADNLTVRDRVGMPENIIGRAVLNAAGTMLYAVSDSGLMVLPIGSLNQYPRLTASQEDLLFQTSFCNSGVVTKNLTITDPGGGSTSFTIVANQNGVTVSPSSGVTPATVQVRVDPSAFQNSNGTATVPLLITSGQAVNVPRPVRVLINDPDQDQRGTVLDVPGYLSDILADPVRNRFYVLRQDRNQVLVFDGATYAPVATLRTATTPTRMAISMDRKYLLVGHDNSQMVMVYDLDSLQAQTPIMLPSGQYVRSMAESNQLMLAVAREGPAPSATGGTSACVGAACAAASAKGARIDSIDVSAVMATPLNSLGIYQNGVLPTTVLAPAPSGGSILGSMDDGTVFLYSAAENTFVGLRQDMPSLQGGYAASDYGNYLVGNTIFNKSLVPVGTLDASVGSSSGFYFAGKNAFRTTASAASGPGVIENIATLQNGLASPTRMSEAPLLPIKGVSFTRTVAPLSNNSAVVALTTSGVTVMAWHYDAAVAAPQIASVVNAADMTQPVAPGGLISVFGQQMSPVNMATQQIPLPTALGDSCLSVNGAPVPLLFVSSQQINAQLPFNLQGDATLTIHTPGGISDNYYFSISAVAPSVFRSGTAGPETGLATIVRDDNNQLVTPSNPIHPNNVITIYATGLGRTLPAVDTGLPAPADPLPQAVVQPNVTLGGMSLNVTYAGLVPGEVGVYQINASVPFGVPEGMDIPLVIDQGGATTTLSVRVVK
ncbi:MAG TPA: hypothetical protein VG675_08060 [Bryobacteraceae bacterium]|nr:hypothetical protein [Bryobacteraceae bacterium]